jgi:integral membrane protein (TIGR01906 family)
MERDNEINLFSIIIKFIMGIFTTISIISISTLITLNATWIYRIIIEKYNLILKTGLTKAQLVKNYKILTNYLQNPFIKKLKFEDFIMSTNGEIHFYEVKNIFLILMIISITFFLGVLLYFILHNSGNVNKINFLDILNYSSNILVLFFISLISAFFIDFSQVFVIFHKIFFRNDYWIFDPQLDPVIIALPEELFKIFAIIVLSILLIVAITIKVLYYSKTRIFVKKVSSIRR